MNLQHYISTTALVVVTSAGAYAMGNRPAAETAIGQDALRPQATCPVMGGKIDKSLYVDASTKRIYVCCQGCIGTVKQNPAKYLKVLKAKGEKVAQLQTTCPVMGGKIDKSLYVDADGKRIYVCCQGCVGTIKADPAKYIKALEAKGVTLDATPQE